MSVAVQNESALPVTVSENDSLVIGLPEDEVPSVEQAKLVTYAQNTFGRHLKWSTKGGEDSDRVVST